MEARIAPSKMSYSLNYLGGLYWGLPQGSLRDGSKGINFRKDPVSLPGCASMLVWGFRVSGLQGLKSFGLNHKVEGGKQH